MRLSRFSVLTFDCYGTLIDWETGIYEAFAPWLAARGVAADRERILEAFAAAEGPQQEATPDLRYLELLGRVHGTMARHFGIEPDAEAAARFGRSVGDWPAFPDSERALGYLKEHYQLVILSNVDRASFARSNERLGIGFDAVYTAEEIGSYKPDPRNFEHMLARLADRGAAREQILHTAESLHHDHLPAKQFGLASCWIHRRAGQDGFGATRRPSDEVRPDFRFPTLEAMAAAHRAELGSDRNDVIGEQWRSSREG